MISRRPGRPTKKNCKNFPNPKFTTLRETAAPATEGQGNRGETQTVEQQLFRNWAKLGTELEQKQKATNDQSNAQNHPKSCQNPCREASPDTLNRSQPSRAPWSKEKSHVTPKLAKKSRKSAESRPKEASLGPKLDPKIDQKAARTDKSASQDGAGSGFRRFLAPSPFEVTFQIDFGRV